MANTDTAVRHLIAVSADPTNQITIDGLGHTAEEAIADAVRAAGLQSNIREDNDGLAGRHVRDNAGDIIDEIFVAQPCTEALYGLVEANGGAGLSWTRDDAGLMDIVID